MAISIFEITDWVANTAYTKNAIVKYNNYYYYAKQDLASNPSFNTDSWGGVITVNAVTKPHFFWVPAYNTTFDVSPRVKIIQFGDGYEQRVKDGVNNVLLKIDLIFDNLDFREAAAICHFLYARNGTDSFYFTPPSPYSTLKRFVARNYQHRLISYDNHQISAKFEEVNN